ncbi:MAG: HEAT repeat domain-containing protein [Anaeromyxobacter sp.]
MRHALAVASALALLAAGCGTPTDPEGWAKRAVSRARTDEKLEAVGKVRALLGKDKDGKALATPEQRRAAVDPLGELLKDKQVPAKVRAEAAVALGEIGDTRAVKGLLDAIDPSPRDRDASDLNRRIADALGTLKATEAVPALEALAKSGDGYTQIAAVDALGKIGDPAAVDTLADIANDPKSEPFTARKAILAIGQIGDDDKHLGRAAVLKAIFSPRGLFNEASFATYQLGKVMAEPLLAVLEGKDAELAAWAKEQGVPPGALAAKASQLLGDVGGADAVPVLVSKLSYTDPEPEVTRVVRVFVADALARLRAKEAVRPVGDLAAAEKDPLVRERYCGALARIGDPAALPALRAMAASAGSAELRLAPLVAISRLGGKDDRAAVEAARAKDCPENKCASEGIKGAYDGMLARLDAAGACGADAACWEKKLEDPSAAVRDRAALEVGAAGKAKQAPALAAAVARPVNGDADVDARFHAVLALKWVLAREPIGPAGAELAGRIDAVLASDRGRTLTAGVNEDALRVATVLRRGK